MRKIYLVTILFLLSAAILPVHAQGSTTCNLDSQEAYVQRGDSERNRQDYQSAAADYTCALNLNDANLDALFGRAYSYYELGEATKAEADYTRYIQLDPNEGAAYNNRGNIYYDRGDYDLARADYDQAIELPYTEKYIPYYNRGSLNYQTGAYQAALNDLNQAINLDSNYADAYLVRAAVNQQLGNSAALTDILQWVNMTRKTSGSENAASFSAGKTLSLNVGTVYNIPITAKSGQNLRAATATPANSQADPLLVLLGPDGKGVAWDDDSGVNFDAVLSYSFSVDGSYTLLLTQAGGGSTGDVSLTLSLADAGSSTTSASPDRFRVIDLAVNQPATVFASKGDHLNLRSGPGLSFDILTKLDRDTPVTLLEGPRKNDGYNWWRVKTEDGKEGWAVERVEEEQTLYPALKAGDQAIVTVSTGTLRVRSGAGTSFALVTQLADGTTVNLLEGPQAVDGFSWWHIRTGDGVEGWAVESASDERTLIRADEANG
jgi:Tfp pilus assembly protein PilF/uncharacterized protein YgiM (DUF1202 family)